MKRRSLLILMAVLMLVAVPMSAFAVRHQERDIKIIVNVNGDEHIVMSDVSPFNAYDRTYLPLRFISEEFGAEVSWNQAKKQATVKKDGKTIVFTVDKKDYTVNGERRSFDRPVLLRDDRTFIPTRAIAEALGIPVDYNQDYNAVYIGENPRYNAYFPIVYYMGILDPVRSDYKVNFVTLKLDSNGSITTFTSVAKLFTAVEADFVTYITTGTSQYGVSGPHYDPSSQTMTTGSSQTAKVVVKAPQTRVESARQLRDDQYVAPTSDPLVGTWYGPAGFGNRNTGESFKTYEYVYITKVGTNRYLVKCRTILASDSSSEFYTEQYGTFDPSSQTLTLQEGHTFYGATGYFSNFSRLWARHDTMVLSQNGTHLSSKEFSDTYYDKY